MRNQVTVKLLSHKLIIQKPVGWEPGRPLEVCWVNETKTLLLFGSLTGDAFVYANIEPFANLYKNHSQTLLTYDHSELADLNFWELAKDLKTRRLLYRRRSPSSGVGRFVFRFHISPNVQYRISVFGTSLSPLPIRATYVTKIARTNFIMLNLGQTEKKSCKNYGHIPEVSTYLQQMEEANR